MSSPPYMKLYIADYLAETTHLSVEGHGAYLLLIMAMWRAGGKLPYDDVRLAKIARCTSDQWASMRDEVLEFFKVNGGVIRHKRVTEEIAKYDAVILASKRAGKASASKRASKNNELDTNVRRNSVERKSNQPEPESKPYSSCSKEHSLTGASAFERFWEIWPNKVAKRAAEKAFPNALKRAGSIEVMLAGIDRAAHSSRKWREGYIPNPATWLNADRWNDDFNNQPDPSNAPSRKLQSTDENMRRALAGFKLAADERAVEPSGGQGDFQSARVVGRG